MKILTYSKMSKPINLQAVFLESKMVIALANMFLVQLKQVLPNWSPCQQNALPQKRQKTVRCCQLLFRLEGTLHLNLRLQIAQRGILPILQMDNILSIVSSSCRDHLSMRGALCQILYSQQFFFNWKLNKKKHPYNMLYLFNQVLRYHLVL